MGFSAPPHARRRAAQPSLSLCMIVKNEAENLERCLETARPHVEEIVIVDTGSTDGTQAIAQRHADVFDEIEWPDSFSKARNHSFDLSSGDYNIWLDGDEHMPDPADWRKVRRAIRSDKVVALNLLLVDALPDNQIISGATNPMLRVVRNHSSIRFKGKVHNQIIDSVRSYCKTHGGGLYKVDATFYHVGYKLSSEEKKAKYGVRIPLLKHEALHAETKERRAYYQFQLAVGYSMIDEKGKALETLKSLSFDLLTPDNALHAHTLAANVSPQEKAYDFGLTHAHKLIELFPEEALGYFLVAGIHIKQGQLKDGVGYLSKTYQMMHDPDRTYRYHINEAHLFFLIGQVAAVGKKFERAEFFFKKCLDRQPDHEEAQDYLTRVAQQMEKQTAAA
ncbi:MAG: glycosyltransferase [Bacteroidetes bacterium]|jgi:glycosyltransferase involved in cell wall biosynthesis|nr:glycosyltransferase [Bacteroidota bacterium]